MRLYLHGNCQTVALAKLLRERLPDWHIRARPVYEPYSPDDLADYVEEVLAADFVVTQLIGAGYGGHVELSTHWLSEHRAAAGLPLHSISQVVFNAELPSFHYLLKDRDAVLSLGHGYHNVLIPHLIGRGWDDARIIDRLCSDDLFTPAFIRSSFQQNMAELHRRERASEAYAAWTHIPVADIVEDQFTRGRLMHSIDHPSAEVLRLLGDRILETIGRPERLDPAARDPLGWLRLPILPSVSRALPRRGDGRYHHPAGEPLDLPDMITRAAAEYRVRAPKELEAMLEERPEVTTFLRAFEAQAQP